VFPCDRTQRQCFAIAVAGFAGILAFAPAPLRSQPLADADVGFEERFLIEERSAPMFTRPEVIELLASLAPYAANGQDVASADPHEPDGSTYSGPIAIAEPKGPAKVLKDLLNTPVKELLVSRAEAGSNVPPPETGIAEPRPSGATAEAPPVPVRAADPVAERPPADRVASAATPMAIPAPEPRPEQPATPPLEVAAAPPPEPAQAMAAAEPPRAEPPSASRPEEVQNADAGQGRRIATGRAAWYQHSGRTASGETFDPNRLTAAHHTLPFGTRVRVVNEATGSSVIVRINDRIPRRARILIDLSRAGGKALGLDGVGRVSLYRLDSAGETASADPAAVPEPAQRVATSEQAVPKEVSTDRRRDRPTASAAKQAKPSRPSKTRPDRLAVGMKNKPARVIAARY
jgi:rare lipoprotein A